MELIGVLCGDKLPEELVLRILTEVAVGTLPEITLSDPTILPMAAHNMLGDVPEALLHRMQDVVLETIPICLHGELVRSPRSDPQSDWTDPLNVVALPAWANLHKIRTLVARSEVHPHFKSNVGMPLLTFVQMFIRTDMPQLREFRLGYQVNGAIRDRRKAMNQPYNDTLTYRAAMEEVIAAVQKVKPGKRRLLQFHFSCERPDKGSNAIFIDERPAAEIMEKAMEKLVTNVKKGRGRR